MATPSKSVMHQSTGAMVFISNDLISFTSVIIIASITLQFESKGRLYIRSDY